MNALLQHRGHNLMGSGRSIAVQNFNEQACILGLGAFYTGMTRVGLSVFGSITIFGVFVAHRQPVADLALAPAQPDEPSRRGRGLLAIARSDKPLSRVTTASLPRPRSAGPVLALLVNAFVWGVSWWPFRHLQAMGLHPLWATAQIYVLSALAIIAVAAALRCASCCASRALWLIFLASGATNATFNWAVSIGDVVRVVLLFYLMPLWSLLLARVILKEKLTRERGRARRDGAGRRGAGAVARRAGAPAARAVARRSCPTCSRSWAASRSR